MSPPDASLDSPLEREMERVALLRAKVSRLEADNATLRGQLAVAEGELGTARTQLRDMALRAGLDCCRAAMLGALRLHFHRAHPAGFLVNGAPPDSAQVPS